MHGGQFRKAEETKEEEELESGDARSIARRVVTPERKPPQKRQGGDDDDDAQPTKALRYGDAMFDAMDLKIMSAVLRGVDITEVYSPQRVAQPCEAFGLQWGSSFGLTTGWGFSKVGDRKAAWKNH